MGSVRHFISVLVASLAILTASGWSGPASACLYDGTSNVVGGAPMAMPAHHWQQQHRSALNHQPTPAPAQTPASSPGGPRLDCAGCIAVLPAFPMIGSHELMPFGPTADTFEPLSGIDPAIDPPPPRPKDR
jgi:hypothetical protein